MKFCGTSQWRKNFDRLRPAIAVFCNPPYSKGFGPYHDVGYITKLQPRGSTVPLLVKSWCPNCHTGRKSCGHSNDSPPGGRAHRSPASEHEPSLLALKYERRNGERRDGRGYAKGHTQRSSAHAPPSTQSPARAIFLALSKRAAAGTEVGGGDVDCSSAIR